MSEIYTAGFWKDAGERAAATALQVLASLFTIDTILNLGSLDYKAIGASVLAAALYSLAKSAIAALTGVKGSASLSTAVEPVRSPAERAAEIAPEIESMVRSQVESVQERLITAQKTAESAATGVVSQVQAGVQSISDVVREQLSRLGR